MAGKDGEPTLIRMANAEKFPIWHDFRMDNGRIETVRRWQVFMAGEAGAALA